MNRIVGNLVLALCIVLTASFFGCAKTPQQESKIDEMKSTVNDAANTVSDSAEKMKASAGDAAGKMQASAGQMKNGAGQYVDDSTITAKIKEKLVAEPATSAYQISVETLNGTVQLSGFVQTSTEKSRAEEIADAVPGVKSVKNDLILKSRTQSMNDRHKIRTA